MVGLSKTRDQLSTSEERIKQLQLETQRTQMDLLAKTGTHFDGSVGSAVLHLLRHEYCVQGQAAMKTPR